jgi:hypothetical protein
VDQKDRVSNCEVVSRARVDDGDDNDGDVDRDDDE